MRHILLLACLFVRSKALHYVVFSQYGQVNLGELLGELCSRHHCDAALRGNLLYAFYVQYLVPSKRFMAAGDFILPRWLSTTTTHCGRTASAARETFLFSLLDLFRVTYAKQLGYYR